MTALDRLLDGVEWKPVGVNEGQIASAKAEGLPFQTHEGSILLGGVGIRVMMLNNGLRLIHNDDLDKLLAALADPCNGGGGD